MEELRFGITLDDRPARVQEMGGRSFTVIGAANHYQEIGVDARVASSCSIPPRARRAFSTAGWTGSAAFWRPSTPFTRARGKIEVPRRKRLRLLKKQLTAVDAEALAKDLYWCVTVEQIEDGIL